MIRDDDLDGCVEELLSYLVELGLVRASRLGSLPFGRLPGPVLSGVSGPLEPRRPSPWRSPEGDVGPLHLVLPLGCPQAAHEHES